MIISVQEVTACHTLFLNQVEGWCWGLATKINTMLLSGNHSPIHSLIHLCIHLKREGQMIKFSQHF